jgi:hypothetical protein
VGGFFCLMQLGSIAAGRTARGEAGTFFLRGLPCGAHSRGLSEQGPGFWAFPWDRHDAAVLLAPFRPDDNVMPIRFVQVAVLFGEHSCATGCFVVLALIIGHAVKAGSMAGYAAKQV